MQTEERRHMSTSSEVGTLCPVHCRNDVEESENRMSGARTMRSPQRDDRRSLDQVEWNSTGQKL